MAKGRVYLVGAGPGDPGLITVRGRELLRQAEVVVYDHLASPRLLAHVPAAAELIYAGKLAADHTLTQTRINELLVAKALAGKRVVRLKGGDPFIFGRGGEEALACVEAGVQWEVVPGITSGVAAAEYSGIPVTHRGVASCLGLITGHETPDKEGSDLNFESLAGWNGTLIFYMGVKNLRDICRSLMDKDLDGSTPAAIIRWGTTPRHRTLVATVATLADEADRAGIKPPAVTIIGHCVALREKLAWFERRPLLGRTIVVTRARSQASDFSARLEELGADVIEMPTIRIAESVDPQPLEQAVAAVAQFDWVVFTSANAVDSFFTVLLRQGRDARSLAGVRVCAIGPATAQRLADRGILVDAQPEKYLGSEVVATLAAREDLQGKAVLCPRADIAPPELIEALTAQGARVTEVVAYRTLADNTGSEHVLDLLAEDAIDWITFTSSSTARNFFAAVPPDALRGRKARLASIGPSTSATVRELGLHVDLEAQSHTIPGLLQAILDVEGPTSEGTE